MARLFQLYKNNKISEEEWSEFVALSTEAASKINRDSLAKLVERLADLFQQLIEPPLSREVVINLIYAVRNSATQG
jgi:hypothetical protein